MLIEAARREYRTWIFDSRRWQHYRPRPDDIVIATYPKCGTTWMQRIVALLVFQTPEAVPLMQISAWIDRRFPEPVEAVVARIEGQTHRRFLKAHLPLDGLPYFDDIKYIHVARDGRDACMSFHHHAMGFTDQMLQNLTNAGMADPTIARPYPPVDGDAGQFFHRWITRGEVPGDTDGSPSMSFFHFQASWWEARLRPNVLMVHYNDLKADLAGQMRRIADYLAISIASEVWPTLVAAAGFEAMRHDSDTLLAQAAATFKHGAEGFFFKGTNERWRGVVSEPDLALYQAKEAAGLTPECAAWVAQGSLRAGIPGVI